MFPKTFLLVPLAVLFMAGPVRGQLEEYQRLPKEAKAILDAADKVELYSLDPTGGMLKKARAGFHGWKVLGKTPLKDAKTRKKVRDAIYKGIAESSGVAGCFHPRHGIRATHKGATVDLVICFECAWMSVHVKDKAHAVWTSFSPRPTLDKVLRDAKVPLPPKPKDE
jgi:hypothetical protein